MGWEFALKQDQMVTSTASSSPPSSTPLTSHTSSPTPHRSYSTLAHPTFPTRGCGHLISGNSRSLSTGGGVGEVPLALLIRDVANFPPRVKELRSRLLGFMEEVVYPAEQTLMDHQTSHNRWMPHLLIQEMKVQQHIVVVVLCILVVCNASNWLCTNFCLFRLSLLFFNHVMLVQCVPIELLSTYFNLPQPSVVLVQCVSL